jgi:hypothetical protein
MERNAEKFALRPATFLETDRQVNSDKLKACSDCCKDQLKTIPSIFVWNADERRVEAAKKWQALDMILSSQAGPEPVTVPKVRDDS